MSTLSSLPAPHPGGGVQPKPAPPGPAVTLQIAPPKQPPEKRRTALWATLLTVAVLAADRYGFHGSGRHGRSAIDGAGEWLRGGAQLRVVAGAAHYWQPVGLQPRRRSGWQRRWHG